MSMTEGRCEQGNYFSAQPGGLGGCGHDTRCDPLGMTRVWPDDPQILAAGGLELQDSHLALRGSRISNAAGPTTVGHYSY